MTTNAKVSRLALARVTARVNELYPFIPYVTHVARVGRRRAGLWRVTVQLAGYEPYEWSGAAYDARDARVAAWLGFLKVNGE